MSLNNLAGRDTSHLLPCLYFHHSSKAGVGHKSKVEGGRKSASKREGKEGTGQTKTEILL